MDENEKMIEEINKVLTTKNSEPLNPEEIEEYKGQFEEYLAKLKKSSTYVYKNPSKVKLTEKQKKQRKAKKRLSNKSRKINQKKNRHNKFTK